MKRFLLLIISFVVLSACQKEKEEPTIIIEPPERRLIEADTLFSGEKWGLAIGDPTEVLYNKIKGLRFSEHDMYLGVTGNSFTGMTGLESSIPLYKGVFFDEKKGTGTGIQISFTDDKVSAIYTNDGKELSKWPLEPDLKSDVVVKKGDPVGQIYGKLDKIWKIGRYSKKFERVNLYGKDVKKPFDTHMNSSTLWELVAIDGENKQYQIRLNLQDRKLISLSYGVYEILD